MVILHDGKAVIVGVNINPNDLPENLEVIGCNMTGTDHLPWDYIKDKGIKVISLEGETEFLKSITSTAEHTMGLIIALFRRYQEGFCNPQLPRNSLTGHTLKGKTLGIIGCGRIGKQVADMASEAFDMDVRVYDNDRRQANLDLLLSNSDVVSIHIPLKENEGFFTKDMFSKMKPTAFYVNTSRPGITAPDELYWALINDTIAGAAIDFIDDMGLHFLMKEHNLILTNHQGGNTYEDRQKTYDFIVEKIDKYFDK